MPLSVLSCSTFNAAFAESNTILPLPEAEAFTALEEYKRYKPLPLKVMFWFSVSALPCKSILTGEEKAIALSSEMSAERTIVCVLFASNKPLLTSSAAFASSLPSDTKIYSE